MLERACFLKGGRLLRLNCQDDCIEAARIRITGEHIRYKRRVGSIFCRAELTSYHRSTLLELTYYIQPCFNQVRTRLNPLQALIVLENTCVPESERETTYIVSV